MEDRNRYPRTYIPESERVFPLPSQPEEVDDCPIERLVWLNPDFITSVVFEQGALIIRFISGDLLSLEDQGVIDEVTEMIQASWPYADHLP
jgi:hypothetical protein